MNVKEEKNEEKSKTRERKIDPEDPSPREEFGEYATKDRSDSTSDRPYAFTETKNESTSSSYIRIHDVPFKTLLDLPHAEYIRNHDVDKLN